LIPFPKNPFKDFPVILGQYTTCDVMVRWEDIEYFIREGDVLLNQFEIKRWGNDPTERPQWKLSNIKTRKSTIQTAEIIENRQDVFDLIKSPPRRYIRIHSPDDSSKSRGFSLLNLEDNKLLVTYEKRVGKYQLVQKTKVVTFNLLSEHDQRSIKESFRLMKKSLELAKFPVEAKTEDDKK